MTVHPVQVFGESDRLDEAVDRAERRARAERLRDAIAAALPHLDEIAVDLDVSDVTATGGTHVRARLRAGARRYCRVMNLTLWPRGEAFLPTIAGMFVQSWLYDGDQFTERFVA